MARYIRKHRRQFAGVAVPMFFLILVGALSLSVFPGWLKPTYGTPGAPCTQLASSNPFSPDCDVCNGEICTQNFGTTTSTTAPFECGVLDIDLQSFTSTIDFSPGASAPQCPNGFIAVIVKLSLTGGTTSTLDTFVAYPGCWDVCTAIDTTITMGTTSTQALLPFCQPSTSFCQGISGGTGSNECRTGECTPISTPDIENNISGCDYEYVDVSVNEDCQLCTDATEAGIPACGNGVCEVDEGEDCDSCSIDCLVPGFEDNCPLTSGTVISEACNPAPTPVVPQITFQGPPYNNIGDIECEDGDVCTDNACSTDGTTCEVTAKVASGNVADFCCPAGAAAPDSGQCSDALGSNCDIDCYIPGECSPNVVELSGNCLSLAPDAKPTTAGAWAMFTILALAMPMALKRRG